MDVSPLGARLRRFALPSPYIVAAPGAQPVGWAAAAAARRRGWTPAVTPAAADLLVVCGHPGPELGDALDAVWDHLPSPRARVLLDDPAQADDALTEARDLLADTGAQRDDHTGRSAGPEDGEMPGGLMMADRGPDRDGLMLDQLHPTLGPVLPDWPTGLQVEAVLQGDVLQEAAARWVDEPVTTAPADAPVLALDALSTLLSVLGWDTASTRAAVLRDARHAGRDVAAPLATLTRTLSRSRRLRAATRGLGVLSGRDVTDRWQAWLAQAAGQQGTPCPGDPDRLGGLLTGTELGTARIVVASLDWAPAGDRATRAGGAGRG
ncbi:hypothetical protein GCM10027047_14270 [Rhodococcus aerolatus]